ncbi:nuclear transport factor 2 family protein [uncultured Tateyamaria sp.]|uniref:nuclear transport factor 2 family protein n=1 Tax=uncultured Tateyamaria sp. TaxID=455651 RepID=UPI002637061A|nr:nuclear transport factor 2 family protein [uncultured Tateyamaria sp.]
MLASRSAPSQLIDSVLSADISIIENLLTESIEASTPSTQPCHDRAHHVSSIDLVGDEAAALVEFTDCTGSSFTDLYVLQKHDKTWMIESKAWDSHAFS